VNAYGVPAAVVDARMVADEQRFPAAEVVADLRKSAAQADRQVVAVRRHLVFAYPEEQTVASSRTNAHLDVQPTTARSATPPTPWTVNYRYY